MGRHNVASSVCKNNPDPWKRVNAHVERMDECANTAQRISLCTIQVIQPGRACRYFPLLSPRSHSCKSLVGQSRANACTMERSRADRCTSTLTAVLVFNEASILSSGGQIWNSSSQPAAMRIEMWDISARKAKYRWLSWGKSGFRWREFITSSLRCIAHTIRGTEVQLRLDELDISSNTAATVKKAQIISSGCLGRLWWASVPSC